MKDGMESIVKDERLLRQLACYSFAVMIITICISLAIQSRETQERLIQEQDATREQEEFYAEVTPPVTPYAEVYAQGGHAAEDEVWEVWQFLSKDTMEELMEEIDDQCVLIRKPKGNSLFWEISENLPYYKITFTVYGAEDAVYAASVLRFLGENYYYGLPDEEEIMKDLSVLSYLEGEQIVSEINMTFDKCYVPTVTEQEEYYILNLRKYSEVYERLIVLDAGHGGKDPGAGAENYRVKEADITLKLLLYLKELLEENTDIAVFCTRTEDVYPTLQERANLALGLEADLFISWHCNASESTSRRGTEVIFNAEQGKENSFNSRSFALLCLDKLLDALGTRDSGITNRQDLHIVRRATMPVVLIETAYLSNRRDLAILKNDTKLQDAAYAVYEAILEAYDLMEEN